MKTLNAALKISDLVEDTAAYQDSASSSDTIANPLVYAAAQGLIDHAKNDSTHPLLIEAFDVPHQALVKISEQLDTLGASQILKENLLTALKEYVLSRGGNFARSKNAKPVYIALRVADKKPDFRFEQGITEMAAVYGLSALVEGATTVNLRLTVSGTSMTSNAADVDKMFANVRGDKLWIQFEVPTKDELGGLLNNAQVALTAVGETIGSAVSGGELKAVMEQLEQKGLLTPALITLMESVIEIRSLAEAPLSKAGQERLQFLSQEISAELTKAVSEGSLPPAMIKGSVDSLVAIAETHGLTDIIPVENIQSLKSQVQMVELGEKIQALSVVADGVVPTEVMDKIEAIKDALQINNTTLNAVLLEQISSVVETLTKHEAIGSVADAIKTDIAAVSVSIAPLTNIATTPVLVVDNTQAIILSNTVDVTNLGAPAAPAVKAADVVTPVAETIKIDAIVAKVREVIAADTVVSAEKASASVVNPAEKAAPVTDVAKPDPIVVVKGADPSAAEASLTDTPKAQTAKGIEVAASATELAKAHAVVEKTQEVISAPAGKVTETLAPVTGASKPDPIVVKSPDPIVVVKNSDLVVVEAKNALTTPAAKPTETLAPATEATTTSNPVAPKVVETVVSDTKSVPATPAAPVTKAAEVSAPATEASKSAPAAPKVVETVVSDTKSAPATPAAPVTKAAEVSASATEASKSAPVAPKVVETVVSDTKSAPAKPAAPVTKAAEPSAPATEVSKPDPVVAEAKNAMATPAAKPTEISAPATEASKSAPVAPKVVETVVSDTKSVPATAAAPVTKAAETSAPSTEAVKTNFTVAKGPDPIVVKGSNFVVSEVKNTSAAPAVKVIETVPVPVTKELTTPPIKPQFVQAGEGPKLQLAPKIPQQQVAPSSVPESKTAFVVPQKQGVVQTVHTERKIEAPQKSEVRQERQQPPHEEHTTSRNAPTLRNNSSDGMIVESVDLKRIASGGATGLAVRPEEKSPTVVTPERKIDFWKKSETPGDGKGPCKNPCPDGCSCAFNAKSQKEAITQAQEHARTVKLDEPVALASTGVDSQPKLVS